MNYLNEPIKMTLDAIAIIFSFVIWVTKILPALASAVTLAWGCIRIYEWWKGRKDGNQRFD
jgi:hypothetical protein